MDIDGANDDKAIVMSLRLARLNNMSSSKHSVSFSRARIGRFSMEAENKRFVKFSLTKKSNSLNGFIYYRWPSFHIYQQLPRQNSGSDHFAHFCHLPLFTVHLTQKEDVDWSRGVRRCLARLRQHCTLSPKVLSWDRATVMTLLRERPVFLEGAGFLTDLHFPGSPLARQRSQAFLCGWEGLSVGSREGTGRFPLVSTN